MLGTGVSIGRTERGERFSGLLHGKRQAFRRPITIAQSIAVE